MTHVRASIALISLVFAACGGITVEVDEKDADATIEVDFAGTCTGQGTETNEFGTVTYAKDDSTGRCEVVLDWVGALVDLGPIKEDIEADAGNRDVTIEQIDVRLKLVQIENALNQKVDVPTLERFAGSVAVANVTMYDLDGTSLDTVVGPDGIEISYTDPETDPVLIAINDALQNGAPLDATARAELTTTSTIPLQENNPHRIVFRHDIHLVAKAAVF